MKFATVSKIQPTGEPPYQSKHGPLYSFLVAFDDGLMGKVNAKNQAGPAYKVGDRVGYEVTGEYQGLANIKVDKKAAEQAGSPPSNSSPVPGQRMPDGSEPNSPAVHGATVGMAVKAALDLHTKGLQQDEISQAVCTTEFWASIHETSSDLIRICLHLEKGKLAPSVKARNGDNSEAEAAAKAAREQEEARKRKEAEEAAERERQQKTQAGLRNPDLDSDVPF